MTIQLDASDAGILKHLQDDARISHAELARRCKIPKAEVSARISKLEEAGIITGYHARINPSAVGQNISAFIRISSRGYVTPPSVVASQLEGVIECHSITGDHDSIVKIVATDVAALENIILQLGRCGATTTSLILSSAITQKPILPVL